MDQKGDQIVRYGEEFFYVLCAVVAPFRMVAAIPLEHTAIGDPSCVCIADRRMFSRNVLPVPPSASRNISLPSSLSILPGMKLKAVLSSALSIGKF